MSIISRIKGEIEKRGQKVDGIVQHSYNPRVNDAVQFFVCSDNQISHIVSTYRNPLDSRKRLYDQNDLMGRILKRVQDTPLRENILFSTWLLDLPQGCFRIQEYKKKRFCFQVSQFDLSDLQKYLDISSDWIIRFKRITKPDITPLHPVVIRKKVKQDISNLKDLYSEESELLTLFSLLENKIEVINSPMILAMHHGDYCHWNCFIDTAGMYRIIDWEFAKISEWAVIDFIANLLVVWVDLRRNGIMKQALRTFFDPRDSNETILAQKLIQLKNLYGFDVNEIKLYFVYVFIRLFLREARPPARVHWEPFLPDMMSILESLD